MSGDHEQLAECILEHKEFKLHIEESKPVRLMVERHDLLIEQMSTLLNKVQNRLPLWATFALTGMGGILGWLVTLVFKG